MQTMFGRILLILTMLTFFNPSLLQAATEQRIALVIGNSAYSSSPLKNPVNDATDMAISLQKMGFNVILQTNVSRRGMGMAVETFGKQLKGRDVGLFFYAGHAVQVNGVNYLIPIDANINQETDVEYEALDTGRILATMRNAKSMVNIVILDACRDNPYAHSFRSTTRGLAIISNAPMGTIVSYSTSPGDVALDGKGRNSPYTSSLIRYMKQPGLAIEQVFKNTRQKIIKETDGKQIPWELSSLRGDFYFVPKSEKAATDELNADNHKLEAEQSRLEKERNTLTKQRELAEKHRKMEEEREHLVAERVSLQHAELEREAAKKKTTLAMAKHLSVTTANEIKRDGRFIAYDDGTVIDIKTNLMWAAKDNDTGITWEDAKKYCENYRGGGYTDWRLPTQNELASLYDGRTNGMNDCNLTRLIELTKCSSWALETSSGAFFRFDGGLREWTKRPFNFFSFRALPVRSVK